MDILPPAPSEVARRVRAWLDSHGFGAECENCGVADKLDIGMPVVLPPYPASIDGFLITEEGGLPVLRVVCGNCGLVRFFDAVQAGVAERAPGAGQTRTISKARADLLAES